MGFPSGDNLIRLYNANECSGLRGKFSPDGKCAKADGKGSFSLDCRGLNPVPTKYQCGVLYPTENAPPTEETCAPFIKKPNADVCKPFCSPQPQPQPQPIRPAPPQKFGPKSIRGLTLWFDAMDMESITIEGSSVTQWNDKSGNGNNATAMAGITWKPKEVSNNLPAVLFRNTKGLIGNVNITGTSLTAFCVFNMSSTSPSYARVLALAAPNTVDYNNNSYISILRLGDDNTFVNARNSAWVRNNIKFDTIQMSTSWVDGATSNIAINANTPISSESSGNFEISSFALGNNTQMGDAAAPLNGSICEVIVFNVSITAAQRQQIEGYLAWKWGLQEQLPLAHPYKYAAP